MKPVEGTPMMLNQRSRHIVRAVTVIDKVPIRLIDGQLHGWTKYRWPLLLYRLG
jgi:hypothetical protein